MKGTLTQDQIKNILRSQSICRIACCEDAHPYVVPISYYYDGMDIYFETLEGKKVEIMRKNPNVCIQTDLVNSMKNYQSVMAFGKFEELNLEDADIYRKELYNNIFMLMTQTRLHLFGHSPTSADKPMEEKPIMARIVITELTGKFEAA